MFGKKKDATAVGGIETALEKGARDASRGIGKPKGNRIGNLGDWAHPQKKKKDRPK